MPVPQKPEEAILSDAPAVTTAEQAGGYPSAPVPSPAQMPQHIAAPQPGQPAAAQPAPAPAFPAPQFAPPAPPAEYAAPPVPQPAADGIDDDDDDLEDELPRNVAQARKLRRENKNLRLRAQENEGYRAQFEAAQAALTRYEVAAAHGITDPADMVLIGSGSREDMDRNAAHLAALRAQTVAAPAAPQPVTPPPSERPVEGLRPGASPEPPAAPDDQYPATWAPRVRNSV